ncbi:histone H3-K4 methyltransferase Set1, partial [Metschnikowia bicuspidata var. bicuspidata NRRL YB-4993]
MSLQRSRGGGRNRPRSYGPSKSALSRASYFTDERYSQSSGLDADSNVPKGPRSSIYGAGRSSRWGEHHHDLRPYTSRDSSPHSTSSVAEDVENTLIPMEGTDPHTGINPGDSKFDLQMHNQSYLSLRQLLVPVDILKNYRVVYDPELDKSLSKSEKKTRHRKLHFQSADMQHDTDPRVKIGIHHYLSKPHKLSKKIPFKQLPRVRLVYDKDSLGSPPQSELVAWDLPASTSEVYLLNFIESFGNPVKSIKFINDPKNAVPLGIATFTFQGNLERALQLAKEFLRKVRSEPQKIDGMELKVTLNDAADKILNTKMKQAQDRLLSDHISREKEERRKQEAKKRKDAEEEKIAVSSPASEKPSEPVESDPLKDLANTTTLSHKHKNKVIKGVFIPSELVKYVKDRPFLFISQKYLPTTNISTQDVKKVLMKYDWTRVLLDRTGFYIVFNTLKECHRCFINEDGLRFFEFRMYMEMCVPENFKENITHSSSSTNAGNNEVDEAVNLLIKDFQSFLGKDIRERIIAPLILDLLNPNDYPELMSVLKEQEKEKEEQRRKVLEASKFNKPPTTISPHSLVSSGVNSTKKGPDSSHVMSLPSFSKKLGSLSNNKKKRRSLFPMQHALNYDDHDSEDSEEDDSSRGTTPIPSSKRELESPPTPTEEEPHKRHKSSKLRESLLYDETSDDDMDVGSKSRHELDESRLADIQKSGPEMKPDRPIAKLENDLRYGFTESSCPKLAYDEEEPQAGSIFDLARFKQIIKDDEDLALARKVLTGTAPSVIEHPQYWAWKQNQSASSAIISEEESIGLLSERLECDTGSFKSQGFRKIADADKIEYLPHRKKIHKPLKTVQNDSEENNTTGGSTSNANNNVQSSRVNRANNRRFAADISAQKQILSSESDILNLNALNKRKKPVSFARSAIHNWGLYALEPIAAKEMIIEYVGESIRQQVAEHREKSYLRTGIGSSYLFRIDENIVIDATKKGGIARFINHCCNPSCTAKIIKVDGKRRIVIYALKDIEANEELTYDYKFERETNDEERIRCLCGAPGCKGYL